MSEKKQYVIRLTAGGIQLGERVLKAGERLGTMLERARKEKNMTSSQLADELPIREYAYDRIEAGYNNNPPDDILEAIAEQLDLDIDDVKDTAQNDIDNPVDPNYYYWW